MRYAQIRSMDISNGEGVGVSLFVQGCPFHCEGCFNPETWNFDGGKEFTPEVRYRFLQLVNRPFVKRVSFLGGEPLANENIEEIIDLIKHIKTYYPDKSIWLYTGNTIENIRSDDIKSKVLEYVDYVIDGRFDISKKDLNLKFRGSSNQRIIKIKESNA